MSDYIVLSGVIRKDVRVNGIIDAVHKDSVLTYVSPRGALVKLKWSKASMTLKLANNTMLYMAKSGVGERAKELRTYPNDDMVIKTSDATHYNIQMNIGVRQWGRGNTSGIIVKNGSLCSLMDTENICLSIVKNPHVIDERYSNGIVVTINSKMSKNVILGNVSKERVFVLSQNTREWWVVNTDTGVVLNNDTIPGGFPLSKLSVINMAGTNVGLVSLLSNDLIVVKTYNGDIERLTISTHQKQWKAILGTHSGDILFIKNIAGFNILKAVV